jgi:Quinolinate synthase
MLTIEKQHPSCADEIRAVLADLGDSTTIIGHHYQIDEVIDHTDLQGDSLALARMTAKLPARNIVFCGVYFMAESSALLARPDQVVYLPEPSAECVMATMSPAAELERVFGEASARGRTIVPVTYVNSTLEVKAFVGRHGGSVCTSANARKVLEWALGKGDAVFFVPDRNLGANTARSLGFSDEQQYLLPVREKEGPFDRARADACPVLLWPGFCPIHTRFNVRQIERIREQYPEVRVIVHPECTPEVVSAADAAGSTAFIIKEVEAAPQGSTLAVGTEIHLVERLAARYRGTKTVVPLVESECIHMAQTTGQSLLAALLDIRAGGTAFVVRAPEELGVDAKGALDAMLQIS